MKTILYQPLFINPQAYFVFPQLYHIEKGDFYIEPANITGQLIINNLSEGLTLTPTVNVIQDSNQVDFSLFKGKHIRISQYTNIGAVVLGEWYIPGTPEPEQPDWFKESIVAWYSPYCKQRMTNYDVIESYLIDLTRGAINNAHGDGSINGQKINITNIKVKAKDIFSIIPGKTEYALKLYVSGQTETNQTKLIYATENNQYISHYLNNGINTLQLTNVIWIAIEGLIVGECNITITQLPTSILKDFSGNGNHAYLYGGKGKLNSGMGLYKVDFTSWRKSSVQTEVKPDVVKVTPNTSDYLFIQYANSVEIPSYKIKVIGLGDNVLKYQYATENGRKEINIVEGENELPTSIKVSNDYQIGYRLTPGTSVFTITQIPDYPNQLCYDGKMYAVCYGFPILTDYTVMADRTWFEKMNRACFLSKITTSGTGAFGFEFYNEYNKDTTYSFGRVNDVEQFKDGITWQITNSYNGIVKLDYIVNGKDNAELYIGKLRPSERPAFIGCHGDILIFNRSLTEYEISWVKNNMMCSKPQETDKDAILMLNIL